jgi:hypothetical protein
LPKIKEIRKQAETSSSPERYEVIPYIASDSMYSRGGTSNSNKEDLNVHTRILHKKTKTLRDEDIEEVCEPVKKREKTNYGNHVIRNHLHIDSFATFTGVTSFPMRSAERTKKAPASSATMTGNAETSVQWGTSPRINKKAPGNKTLTSSKGNNKLLFVYPFDFEVKEEKLQEISSQLTELGGNPLGEPEAHVTGSDDTESKEECVGMMDLCIISSTKHKIPIYVDDRERLKPNIWLNDSLVDLWMSWYVCFFCYLSVFYSTKQLTQPFIQKDFQKPGMQRNILRC